MSLITITTGIGCEGHLIAQRVADEIKVELYDDERLQKEALASGLSKKDLKSLDEKAPGLLSRLLDLKPQTYQELMEAVVYEVAGRGEGIILGHGAPFLLRDFGCAFHISIHASLSSRITHLMESMNVERRTAEKMIQKSDSDRTGFMKFAFNMDLNDPSLYDLTINRDKLGLEGAVELIIATSRCEALNVCGIDSIDAMKRLSLLKNVEAEIRKTAMRPRDFNVEVPELGIVIIVGMINALESRDRLVDAVKALPGVKEVKTDFVPEKLHDF
jgi:cytidylate kinase